MTVNTPKPRNSTKIIARNTFAGLISQFALRGIGFLFTIFVVRRLGDAGYGQYSIVLAWTGIFSFIGDMGITQYMTREIARDRDKSLALFWDVIALRFMLTLITILITVVGASFMSYSRELILAVALYCLTYIFEVFLAPLTGIIAGYERLDLISGFYVIGQAIFLTAAILLLILSPNFLLLIVAGLVNMPFTIGMSLWIIFKYKMVPPHFKLSPSKWLSLLRFGLPFAFIQVALTFAFRFDTLVLERNFSEQVVGWYNAAYTFTRSLLMITSAFSVALVPTMARDHVLDPASVHIWYARSVKLIAFIGFPLAVGGTLLADQITLLFYGPMYLPSILAMAILIWDTPLLMYTSLCGNFTTAMKIEKKAAWVYGSESIFNILLNLYLIPRYGILAAATVTLSTELVGAILFYRIFWLETGSTLSWRPIVRLLISGLIMGLAVFLLRDLHIIFNIALGVGVYLTMIMLTRFLTREEQDLIIKSFQKIKSAVQNRV